MGTGKGVDLMDIRMGTPADAEALAEVEALCFPAAVGAGEEGFRARRAG